MPSANASDRTTPMTQPEAKRIEALRDLLRRACLSLKLPFGFALWDGSVVPEGLAPEAMRIRINHEGVIAGLLRNPRLNTLIDAYVSGYLEIENGTIFDLAAVRPQAKLGRVLRGLGAWRLARLAARYWRAPRPPKGYLAGITEQADARSGDVAVNKRNVAYHYDVSNAFYQLFLDDDMIYTCAFFQPEWHGDLARAQRDKLDMICRKLRRAAEGERFLDIGCGWGALVMPRRRTLWREVRIGVTLSPRSNSALCPGDKHRRARPCRIASRWS
jgi:cyclopropane-fatty-acyl-phospholipid synthase